MLLVYCQNKINQGQTFSKWQEEEKQEIFIISQKREIIYCHSLSFFVF